MRRLAWALLPLLVSAAANAEPLDPLAFQPRRVRTIETASQEFGTPAGIAYSPKAGSFLVLEWPQSDPSSLELRLVGMLGQPAGALRLPAGSVISNPLNLAFDARYNRLLLLDGDASQLLVVPAQRDGIPDPERAARYDAAHWDVADPQGMAVDADGRLFLLDRALSRLVVVEPDASGSFERPLISTVALSGVGSGAQGLAIDATNHRLFVMNASEGKLYALRESGAPLSAWDVPELQLANPRGMTLAPSGDQTDDPNNVSLYVADTAFTATQGSADKASESTLLTQTEMADTTGAIVELGLSQTAQTQTTSAVFASSLVALTRTSDYNPPSPDPSGITFLPDAGTLWMCDGEVEETRGGITHFAGIQVWETSLGGSVVSTHNVQSFTNEPTGVTVNPANRHLFYTDDNHQKVYEVDPGLDGLYHTGDDVVTSFSTLAFGSTDPEDLVYDPSAGVLFVDDGVNAEIYWVSPGPDGVFNGIAPTGDDVVTSFDTAALGVTDPEGVALDPDTGHLYVVGQPVTQVAEVTTNGQLIQRIDISAAAAIKPAGMVVAPGSLGGGSKSLYIVDRGVDNDVDPTENDGLMYEMTLPTGPPANQSPAVNAGVDQTITLPAAATLVGTVGDDGLPNPPGAVTVMWSVVSGPGSVSFGSPNAASTTASFASSGSYVLRLTASDGASASSDDVTVNVNPAGLVTTEVRISTGSDDAEERPGGAIARTSGDLELVYSTEGTTPGNQTVGLRFPAVAVPQGSTIYNAYVQFQADQGSSGATALTIDGQAADNAAGFTTTAFSLTSRPRTTASAAWSPAAWSAAGEAGPNERTSNLAALVQEIVSRPGWASGNALVLLVYGSGNRVAESFEGTATGAPLLHVEYVGAPQNQAPVVSAGQDQAITLPAMATLAGTASDDGLPNPPDAVTVAWSTVSGPGSVTFGDPNAVSTTASFSNSGSYVLRLTASDGALSSSDDITITVSAPNRAPLVNAGADQTVTLPASATLAGTVSDDGLPNPPGAVTVIWSVIDGPGTVSFANPNSVSTTASFSAAGVYVLRLTASDGVLGSSDDVIVTVNPAGVVTTEGRISAGADDAEERPGGAVARTSNDLELVYSTEGTTPGNQTVGLRFLGVAIPRGAAIQNAYVQFQANNASSGSTTLTIQGQAADNAPAFKGTDFNITSRARTAASALWAPAAWTAGEAGANERSSNLAAVIQEVVNRSGWASGNALALIVTGTGLRVAQSYEGSAAGAALLHVEYSQTNQAPVVNAGADQTVTLPASATLTGTASDDGLPNPPGAVTGAWSMVSGPGSVSFANPNSVSTTASFSTAGAYVLRLTASDGALSSSDDLSVTVNPAGSLTFEVRIATKNDDSEERPGGAISRASSDLELVYSTEGSTPGNQTVGLRFVAVAIPPGAIVQNAYVQFQASQRTSDPTTLTIQGQAADNATAFKSTAFDLTSRARTAAAATWSPTAWDVVGEAGVNQRTSNLAGVIQEIVGRPGWAGGNALVLLAYGSGNRVAESFDGTATGAALLHVEYSN